MEKRVAITGRRRSALIALCCLLAGAAPAVAQDAQEPMRNNRTFRGLFGGANPQPKKGQSLTLEAKLFEGYEVARPRTGVEIAPLRSLPSRGFFESLSGGPTYQRQGDALSFGVQEISTFRRYDTTNEIKPIRQLVWGWLNADLGSRTQIRAHQFVRYSPFFLHGGMGNVGEGQLNDLALELNEPVTDRKTYTYATNAELRQQIGTRWVGTIFFSQRMNVVSDRGFDSSQRRLKARLVRNLTQRTSAHVGYGYHTADYANGRQVLRSLDLDAGVNYERSISLTRGTFFTFTTGSAVLRRVDHNSFRLVGDAGLSKEMGRSWVARVAYRRRLIASEIFAEPVMLDFISGSLSGYLNPRVDLTLTGRHVVRGPRAVAGNLDDYGESLANAQIRFALSHVAAIYAQYLYYDYRIGNSLTLVGTPVRSWQNNSARVGLTLWVPIIGKR